MIVKAPLFKEPLITSFNDAKLISADEGEIVIEFRGEKIELPAIHGHWDRDKIGKVGSAKFSYEYEGWAFVIEETPKSKKLIFYAATVAVAITALAAQLIYDASMKHSAQGGAILSVNGENKTDGKDMLSNLFSIEKK